MIKGKKLADIIRKLKAKNRRFKRMSLGNQRKAIARDVITQLDDRKMKAESENAYLQLSNAGMDKFDRADPATDLSVILEQTQCTVCGIGSLFVSAVKYNDKLSKNQTSFTFGERWVHANYLRKWFDNGQLSLIEQFFERKTFCYGPIVDELSDTKRLKMIMENIISNGGKFDPDKGKHSEFDA